MDIKTFLGRAFRLKARIEAGASELARLREPRGAAGPAPQGGAARKGARGDATGEAAAMAADLEASLRRDARLYAAARAEIGAVVGAVGSGRLGLLLRKRYLLFEGWGKIAGDMGYSAKYVFELHRLALAEAEAAREKVKDLTSPYLDMWYDI